VAAPVLLVALGSALIAALIALRAAWRQAADWRRAAYKLADCVRGVDAWPLVEHVGTERRPEAVARPLLDVAAPTLKGIALVPIPPSVAVMGRSAPLDRWALQTADALRAFDLLVEPEGDR
jgi:hypothetical protein